MMATDPFDLPDKDEVGGASPPGPTVQASTSDAGLIAHVVTVKSGPAGRLRPRHRRWGGSLPCDGSVLTSAWKKSKLPKVTTPSHGGVQMVGLRTLSGEITELADGLDEAI